MTPYEFLRECLPGGPHLLGRVMVGRLSLDVRSMLESSIPSLSPCTQGLGHLIPGGSPARRRAQKPKRR
jgi:hypothetical protein